MLVLRRKVGESIILDGVISVSVLAVEGERVKIGITAPPDVTIVREELLKNASSTPASTSELPPSPTQSVQSESAPRL
jgi:carbon storage regulator